jgi:tRNA (cmo5U34)-methyltransferase
MSQGQASASPDLSGEKRFAGALSDDYPLWRLARPFLGEVHGVVSARLAEFAHDRAAPLRAVDIGMGDGAITRLLLAEPKLYVTGIDNEPKMIAQAEKALHGAVAEGRLKIVLEDAHAFIAGLPADSVDIATSGYVLHNLTEDYRDKVYGDIFRVLKPGGLFINADKYAQSGQPHRDALRWQLGLFFDVLAPRQKYDLLRDWVLHYVEDEMPGRVMLEADAVSRLERVGFEDVAIVYRKHMDAVLVARKPD